MEPPNRQRLGCATERQKEGEGDRKKEMTADRHLGSENWVDKMDLKRVVCRVWLIEGWWLPLWSGAIVKKPEEPTKRRRMQTVTIPLELTFTSATKRAVLTHGRSSNDDVYMISWERRREDSGKLFYGDSD
jgi:hypothetical protein